jgi:hypothetical protein
MSQNKVELAAVLSVTPTADKIELQFRDKNNNIHCISIPSGALGGLLVGLRSVAATVPNSGSVQPMTLNSGRPFSISDGRVGLEFTLDNAVRLPVLFPREAIPVLRRSLDELEHLSKSAPATPRPN